ncbi:MAG: alcohol dehydrogenase catalytic domain-containing protein [Nitrososphaerales archaeon]
MKAQLLTKIGSIETNPLIYQEVPTPEVKSNEVLIRIKACGVCHSNIHMIEGEFQEFGIPSKLPIIPGHEITGIIEEKGKDVEGLEVNQRVGVQVLYESCRKCEYCTTGRENLCLSKKTTGERCDGGYAEYIVAPYDFIYSLPDNLSFEEATPLFCAGVTAYRAVKRASITFGQRVAIVGIGGVGHMALQLAKLAGAEVIAIDKYDKQLKLAEELGAEQILLARDAEAYLSKEGKVDVVMLHAPSKDAIDLSFKILKRGGLVLMAVLGNLRFSFAEEYTIIGSVMGTRKDMKETLRLASLGKIRTKWKAYNLTEANDVLLRLKRGEIVGRALLIP